ncbi:hypothetical protein ACI2LF_32025 [Kribbella sp. NPDC020789]
MRQLSNDEQDAIVGELMTNIESLSEEEIDALYNRLDIEHKMEVDQGIREFADNAVGDEHWVSDR